MSLQEEIDVKLNYLRLDCHSDVTLIIRDGSTTYSPLIQIIHSGAQIPLAVAMTTTSKIFMELDAGNVTEENQFPQCVTGFVASLRVGKIIIRSTSLLTSSISISI